MSEALWRELQRDYADMPGWPQYDGKYKLSAGWLIDRCGWKGKRLGNVGTYERHALVLVNHGGAEGHEVWQFAQHIIADVYENFGVTLEPEPQVISP